MKNTLLSALLLSAMSISVTASAASVERIDQGYTDSSGMTTYTVTCTDGHAEIVTVVGDSTSYTTRSGGSHGGYRLPVAIAAQRACADL